MPGKNLVIVESPAKAKTINKYLGNDYTVLASFGHIRDLPPKDGSVRPDEDFAMDWELGDRAKKHVDEIARAAKDASRVYLATDPDREGEAISWHVREVLSAKRGLGQVDFQRITFNEITKRAVQEAIASPRALNRELIEAYLARRALDYLVGFTLSPVLWRKLPGSKSAGRVQSVALRLICEREAEIEDFVPREYWTIEAVFVTPDGSGFTARLTHLDGEKLDKFGLPNEQTAKAAADKILRMGFTVASVERKEARRNPAPPFTTSTLQQEASRKLGFGATKTMRTAQRLYEGVDLGGETVGLITYMRTDGTQLSQDAVASMRGHIGKAYGERYLPKEARVYKSTAKNAQEAHEAIRPTEITRRPEDVEAILERDAYRLYDLIWKRAVACQMASAILDQVAVDIAGVAGGDRATFRATGSVVKFDGFLKVYEEGRDEKADDDDEKNRRLPPMQEGQALDRTDLKQHQHFTQPPPRFTEASLVKRMEELGIGRPSTYASILQVLQDREYVVLDKRRFQPEDRGRLVTTFLHSFFRRYVEYDFTARLEGQLDEISGGRIDWKQVLRDFWQAFSAAVDETKGLSITQVIDALDAELGPHFFRDPGDGSNPRACPSCSSGRLGLKLSRTGAFIGCSNYPDCRYTRPLEVPSGDGDPAAALPRELGADPETGLPVSVRKGPFGVYVQLGPRDEEDKEKPKRASLPKNYSPLEIDLETALKLLALPRTVGDHPETRKTISAGIGRYGPYLRHDGAYKSLPADDDVLSIGMNRAVELLATAKKSGGGDPLKELGAHPADQKPIGIYSGRYGPYVKHGSTMASLPKGTEVDTVTVEQAVELLDAKAAKKGGKTTKAAGKTAAKATAGKTGTKTASKAAAPKATGTKTAGKQTAGTKTAGTKSAGRKSAANATGDTAGGAADPGGSAASAPPRPRAKTAAAKSGSATSTSKTAAPTSDAKPKPSGRSGTGSPSRAAKTATSPNKKAAGES